jgi:hypothetical protein
MYTLANGDILETRLITFANNQLGESIIHFRCVDPVGGVTDQGIATLLDSLVGPGIGALMTTIAQYRGMIVQKIYPLPRLAFVFGNAGAGPGSAGTTPLPAQCTYLAKFLTAKAGQPYRGRVYLPFPDEANQNDLTVTPNDAAVAQATAVISAWAFNGLYSPTSGGSVTLQPVIWHRKAGTHYPIVANTSDDITSFAVEQVWATQRRRGDLGKANVSPI